MSVSVPGNIVQWAQAAASETQIVAALIALSYYESSWNPGAIGDGGCSFGLLQYYRCGGLGDPYTPAELLDGANIMRLGAQYIRARMAAGASLYDALSPWSTRALAWPLLNQILAEGINGAPPGDGGGYVPRSGIGGPVALMVVGILLYWLIR